MIAKDSTNNPERERELAHSPWRDPLRKAGLALLYRTRTEREQMDDYLKYDDLTDAQKAAVDKWWEQNNPDDFECQDNTRLARVGNEAEEIAYQNAKDAGCCGFVDEELTCDDGTILLFGFNYGH